MVGRESTVGRTFEIPSMDQTPPRCRASFVNRPPSIVLLDRPFPGKHRKRGSETERKRLRKSLFQPLGSLPAGGPGSEGGRCVKPDKRPLQPRKKSPTEPEGLSQKRIVPGADRRISLSQLAAGPIVARGVGGRIHHFGRASGFWASVPWRPLRRALRA